MICEICKSNIDITEENTMVSQGILFVMCDNCGSYSVDIDLEEDSLLELYMDSKE